jgi:hypothetical protein
MEEELKDYILVGDTSNPFLNVLIDLVMARLESGEPYRAGGLFDQPYFLKAYVEPWVQQAREERKALNKVSVDALNFDQFVAHQGASE